MLVCSSVTSFIFFVGAKAYFFRNLQNARNTKNIVFQSMREYGYHSVQNCLIDVLHSGIEILHISLSGNSDEILTSNKWSIDVFFLC